MLSEAHIIEGKTIVFIVETAVTVQGFYSISCVFYADAGEEHLFKICGR